MKLLHSIKSVCEIIGGSRDLDPGAETSVRWSWLRGIWWGLLAGAIILFCGQTSKFIYIDF